MFTIRYWINEDAEFEKGWPGDVAREGNVCGCFTAQCVWMASHKRAGEISEWATRQQARENESCEKHT